MMLCPERISPRTGMSLMKGISMEGITLLLREVEMPRTPVRAKRRNTVPPLPMRLIAMPARMSFTWSLKIM